MKGRFDPVRILPPIVAPIVALLISVLVSALVRRLCPPVSWFPRRLGAPSTLAPYKVPSTHTSARPSTSSIAVPVPSGHGWAVT